MTLESQLDSIEALLSVPDYGKEAVLALVDECVVDRETKTETVRRLVSLLRRFWNQHRGRDIAASLCRVLEPVGARDTEYFTGGGEGYGDVAFFRVFYMSLRRY